MEDRMNNHLKKLALQYRARKILLSPIWRHDCDDLQKVSDGQITHCLFCGTDLPVTPNSSYSFEELAEVHKHFIGFNCSNCGARTWHHYEMPENIFPKDINVENYKDILGCCLLTEAVIDNEKYKLFPVFGESYQTSHKLIHKLERKPLTQPERALLNNLKVFSSEVHKLHGRIRVYEGNPLYKLLEKGVHLSENPRKTIKELMCEIDHTQTEIYSSTPLHVGYHNVVKFFNWYGVFDYKKYYEVDQEMLDELIMDQ